MCWCVCLRVRLWFVCCARFDLLLPSCPLLPLLPCPIGPFRPIIMLTARVWLRWPALSSCSNLVFWSFFWLFGRARTTANGHPLFALPPSRVPTLNYVSLHPCKPLGAHHGHTWASLTHSRVHVMLFCILACLLCCAWWSCVRVWCVCLRVLGCFPLVHVLTLTLNTCAYVAVPFPSLYSLVR